MKIHSILQKYFLIVIIIILACLIIILSNVLPPESASWIKKIENASVVLGWVLFLVQYFSSRSTNFYLFINNIRLWMLNEAITWDFVVKFKEIKTDDPINMIWKQVFSNSKMAKWFESDDQLIIDADGYSIRIILTEENINFEAEDVINIQISNLEIPFRNIKKKIQYQIIPLIQKIQSILAPQDEKYVAKIKFNANNPYFGYFLKKVDLPEIISFECEYYYKDYGLDDQVITVRKDRIDIVTNDLVTLQNLTMRLINLSSEK